MSILQFKGEYFVSYLSQAVFNLTVIVFILLFHSELGIFSIVYGALVGGFLQVLFVFYFFKKLGGEIYFDFYPYRRVKNFFKNLLPQVGSTGIGHLSTLAEAFFATAVGGGILSSLYYAMRIFQLGVSFVSVSLKNVSLSEISKEKGKDKHTLRESLKLGILLSVPAAIGLFILSEDIVKVIYQHGIFNENNTQRVALFLSVYSFGLVPYTLFEIGKSKLFKEEKYWKAFKYSSVWFFVEVPIAAIGVFLLKLGGVAIAFSYTFGIFVALFVFLLREKIVSIKKLFEEIKPKYYLLWFFEVVFLLGLKALLKNPYAVVFVGIPLFGIPYLYILYRER
jgi:putative peptidoglycan lipid II flippase